MKKIDSFRGAFAFLSNFHPSEVEINGRIAPTVEHAYQASKCKYTLDHALIILAPTPGSAKKIGQKVKMREDWEDVKFKVMKELLIKKFAIPELRSRLLATGNAHLEEGNWWGDRIWGTVNGEGENHLGKLLMEVREEIRQQEVDYANS